MTELLCRLFVRDGRNINDPDVRRRYGMMVSIVAISLNILLFAGKFVIGKYIALSIAIYADAMNNLADAGSSLISLVSFRIASKPADRKHPFGHARIEYVTSMIVAFLVLHTGLDVLTESIGKLTSGTSDTTYSIWSVVVLSAAIAAKLWLCLFNRKIGRRINSSIMKANAADSLSDALSTSGVLVATLLLFFFPSLWFVDAVVGLIVAAVILWSGIKIFNETKNSILGEAPEEGVVESITEIVSSYDGALGVHDMFLHGYGPGKYMVSLHVEVDGSTDVFESHDMIDNIEKAIRDRLGYICTIHLDPIVTDDEQVTALRAKTSELVQEIDGRLRIHDFRFVAGQTHTNLIFDIAAPFEVALTDDELIDAAAKRVATLGEIYFAVITVDRE